MNKHYVTPAAESTENWELHVFLYEKKWWWNLCRPITLHPDDDARGPFPSRHAATVNAACCV